MELLQGGIVMGFIMLLISLIFVTEQWSKKLALIGIIWVAIFSTVVVAVYERSYGQPPSALSLFYSGESCRIVSSPISVADGEFVFVIPLDGSRRGKVLACKFKEIPSDTFLVVKAGNKKLFISK